MRMQSGIPIPVYPFPATCRPRIAATRASISFHRAVWPTVYCAIERGQRVLIVDDLLATGGTAVATAKLASSLGGEIAGLAFVVELDFLKGRERLATYNVFSLLHYDV